MGLCIELGMGFSRARRSQRVAAVLPKHTTTLPTAEDPLAHSGVRLGPC